MQKKLLSVHAAYRDDIADLMTRRPLPGPDLPQIDPFLFLNHHGPQVYPPNNNGLPFGPHPHRGFETVTFILTGNLAHRDTAGHESIIEAGGVQWMTAGSGLIHSELSPAAFLQTGGPLEILQLWINLPACLKMTAPAYTGLQKDQIPVCIPADTPDARIELIAGQYADQRGPVHSLTDVFMSVVYLPPGATVRLPAPAGRQVFCYVVEGEAEMASETGMSSLTTAQLGRFDLDGDGITLRARHATRLLYGHALPTDEPVVSHGPFVMNTREEITQAIRDYQAGLFEGVSSEAGKH